MHENNEGTAGALPVLRPGLECIPVRSDPRRVSVSEMYEEDPGTRGVLRSGQAAADTIRSDGKDLSHC